ncbi:MAG: hypothetical protein F4X64_15200, partial [Chloroflexi bacterium]|nr:hypothetical protein [Chloroflexota bacterium]
MATGIVLPTTYRQIQQAAADYNNGRDKYNDAYRAVYEGNFRRNLVERGNDTDMKELTLFLNKWRCHLSRDRTPAILKLSVPQAVSYLKPLSGLSLGVKEVSPATFRAVETAFDRLIEDKGIAATVASKILGVLSPEFCVAWDKP